MMMTRFFVHAKYVGTETILELDNESKTFHKVHITTTSGDEGDLWLLPEENGCKNQLEYEEEAITQTVMKRFGLCRPGDFGAYLEWKEEQTGKVEVR